MIGSFFTRGLVMLLGYAYPAYECFKTVEKNKPDIAQLRFWCQYWILVALLTVCERIGDAFISWVPMYSEAKLAFFIYLWYPKTKGTTYVYDSFFRPYVAKHETEIDRNLLELRAKAGDIAVTYWQRAASYGQTRVFEILQYIASQSVTAPRPSQPQANRQASAISQPLSSTSSTSSPEEEGEAAGVVGPSQADPGANITVNAQKSTVQETAAAPPTTEPASKSTETRAEAMQIEEVAPSLTTENANPPSRETVVEETSFRFTRGRLRKTRSNS